MNMKLCSKVLVLLLGTVAFCTQPRSDGVYDVLDSMLPEYDTLYTSHLKHTLTTRPHTRRVKFSSLGRWFELHLRPSTRFTRDFTAYSETGGGKLEPFLIDTNQFYHGYIHGEAGSRVTAHVSKEGVVSALITTLNETYHIEPSTRYLTKPHPFHMIVYRSSQVPDRLGSGRLDYTVAPSIPEHELDHLEKSHFHSNFDGFQSERLRRQSGPRISESSCSLLLIADHTVFTLLNDRDSVANFMIQLVLSVDSEIYRETEWILDTSSSTQTDLGLFIKGILVHTQPNTTNPDHYNVAGNLDAGSMLGRMRLFDWSDYCLAHLFVDRSFESGLLGLANIASPSLSQTGGICSIRFRDNGLSGAPFVIYNTGLTTLRNRGQLMVMSELVRVTGHELGHNWGSHHDTSSCGPGWLMNEYAQDGSQPTHSMFSSCSRTSIGQVLLSKARFCFTTSTEECGDRRVTDGEECDVGDDDDPCCFRNCTFKPLAICSDQNSPCCQNCQYALGTEICRLERNISLNCVTNTFCNGLSADCPSSPMAPPGALCINGVCDANGTCNGHCFANNMENCRCTGADECLQCCMSGGVCSPLEFLPNTILALSDGANCSMGVCINGSCSIITQDEISRIWSFITTLDVNAFRVFLSENIVGCVLFFSLLLWCPVGCSIHYCYDHPNWKKFTKTGKEGTDMGEWFSERIATFNKMMEAASREQSQGLSTLAEEEPLLAPSSPVDDGPPPTYS